MSDKRYVVIHKGFGDGSDNAPLPRVIFDDPERARKAWGDEYTVYELGPEVKEPDYTLLVWWVSVAPHGNGCRWQHDSRCDCGLTDALRAAGIK